VRPVSLGSYFEDVPGWVAAVLRAVEHDGAGVEVHGEMEGEGKRGIVIGIDAPTAVIYLWQVRASRSVGYSSVWCGSMYSDPAAKFSKNSRSQHEVPSDVSSVASDPRGDEAKSDEV
jgi:hypothetical protein